MTHFKLTAAVIGLLLLAAHRDAFAEGGGFGGGGGGIGGGARAGTGSFSATAVSVRTPPSAAVITTQSIDDKILSEWKEDLTVMDKLLRDEVVRISGEQQPTAMGIRLTGIGSSQPIYLEDYGALFGYSANIALAKSGKIEPGKEQKTDKGESPWERAKREMAQSGNGGETSASSVQTPTTGGGPVPGNWSVFTSGRSTVGQLKFDQATLDELIDAILRTLPQAKNVRNLKDSEFVIVTVSGSDDAGKPARLTLKAKKADVDQAAGGTLTPEEFKQRVTRKIY